MKKTTLKLLSILSLLLGLTLFSNAYATTITITLGEGTLKWNGKPVMEGCDCTKGGDDCKVTITLGTFHVTDGGTSWLFSGDLTYINAVINEGTPNSFSADLPVSNFEFPDGSYMDVPEGAEPGIPALHLSLTNIATDASGHFSGSQIK